MSADVSQSLFDAALLLIAAGGDYRISGPNLSVANLEFEMTEEQQARAWDAIKEGDDGR